MWDFDHTMDGGTSQIRLACHIAFYERISMGSCLAINACCKKGLDKLSQLACANEGRGGRGPKFNQFVNHKSPLKITRLYSWPFPNSNVFPFLGAFFL
jgi:hypothetical protein